MPSLFIFFDLCFKIEKGNQKLKEPADFTTCTIDPAPFQIFCKTSLFKVLFMAIIKVMLYYMFFI